MRKNRLIILVLSILECVTTYSQTQEGYVKTLGRPNKKGIALNGVSIKVKDEHNPVLSKNDGTFSILLINKKNGDSYSLQEVRKNGYELNETGVIGRQYAFSDRVPLTIVMVSSSQLQADKQRIENNAFRTAEKNYKSKLALLEEQNEKNTISIEKYREELQDLQDKFEKYQLMIDGLAEHYAHVDYDVLDENGQKINTYIENGELERADSLINQMFDPIDALRRNKEALSKIHQQLSQANDLMDKANEDWVALLKQQEKDAEHLYQLYTIALSRFEYDKARFYIETRAKLDTTKVDWQGDAGLFVCHMADYNNASVYYIRGLNQAKEQYGDNSVWVALFYNNIGGIYSSKGDYTKALECHTIALNILKRTLGENHPKLAPTYNNIGGIYSRKKRYTKAMRFYSEALSVIEKNKCDDSLAIARIYNNIGVINAGRQKYAVALEGYTKALSIQKHILCENHPEVAISYNNIGNVYLGQEDYSRALDYYTKALNIQRLTLGENHPDVALSYYNIGCLYSNMGEISESMKYHIEALEINKKIFEEDNLNVAASYNSIGYLLFVQENYKEAMNYLTKAYVIAKNALGERDRMTMFYDYCIKEVEGKIKNKI